MIERNEKIASLYYKGYSRRAIAEAFEIGTERVAQILLRHARANDLQWPPRNITEGNMPRYDHPKDYKPIPVEELAPEAESLGADFWRTARVVIPTQCTREHVAFIVEVANKDGLQWAKWSTYCSEEDALLGIKKILPRPDYPTDLALARIVRVHTIRQQGSIHRLS